MRENQIEKKAIPPSLEEREGATMEGIKPGTIREKHKERGDKGYCSLRSDQGGKE